MVKLKNLTSVNYYSQILQPVTNGNFSFTTNICGVSQQFEIVGEDYVNLQTTNAITFTATAPVTNIGVITTCNAVNEFITYQVDSNPVNYIVSNINAGINGSIAGLYITSSQNMPFLYMNSNVVSIGSYTTSQFNMEFSVTPGTITGIGSSTVNTVQFVVSQIGSVGGYIDVTFNGTYDDTGGTHTISGTAHVIRDN